MKPDKVGSLERIDCVVALLNALGHAMLQGPKLSGLCTQAGNEGGRRTSTSRAQFEGFLRESRS